MAEAVTKVPLLEGKREWMVFLLVAASIFFLRLAWEYRVYCDFVDRPFSYTWGDVLEAKSKESEKRRLTILKVRTDGGLVFWTRTFRQGSWSGVRVRLQLFPSRSIAFTDYLKGPFVPSRIKRVVPPRATLHSRLGRWIASEHVYPETAAFYRGIFLGDSLPRELRRKIAALGVSHLVALSGFHLGILWGGIFLLLQPLYRWAQRRRFPWRYDRLDLGTISLVLLAGYLWLTGMPPSLLRSYVMLLFGWAALLLGIEIVRFSFLILVGAVLLALFPSLIFSWGFWLSMSGVFAIYLLVKYWRGTEMLRIKLFLLPVGIYWLMAPVTHSIFEVVSPWQNLSPILSVLFVVFYPAAILLHLVGWGNLLDPLLLRLWELPHGSVVSKSLPTDFFVSYILLGVAAARWRWAFYLLVGWAGASIVWIYL